MIVWRITTIDGVLYRMWEDTSTLPSKYFFQQVSRTALVRGKSEETLVIGQTYEMQKPARWQVLRAREMLRVASPYRGGKEAHPMHFPCGHFSVWISKIEIEGEK